MSKATPATVIDTFIISVDHDSTSAMGNPTYRVGTLTGQSYRTETNGSVGYSAQNFRPRSQDMRAGTIQGTPVTLTLRTIRGEIRIVGITRRDV